MNLNQVCKQLIQIQNMAQDLGGPVFRDDAEIVLPELLLELSNKCNVLAMQIKRQGIKETADSVKPLQVVCVPEKYDVLLRDYNEAYQQAIAQAADDIWFALNLFRVPSMRGAQ